ncbi:hypothetical protein KAW65_00475 [candidate division WOR-3 bacterium]|nr:hypothetical protein [candidate division WOR-3 bacterium]
MKILMLDFYRTLVQGFENLSSFDPPDKSGVEIWSATTMLLPQCKITDFALQIKI